MLFTALELSKDGFYVLSGSLSACIIASVLLGDLQSLKYLLSSLQKNVC